MIFNILLTIMLGIINLLFSWVPVLPDVPVAISNAITDFFDLLFSNSGLVSFFLPMNLVKIALPIAIILFNFKYIYKMVMWLIRKLPWAIQ